MKNWTVVVWTAQGLRVYEVRAPGPVTAARAAQQQDSADYPDDPADWNTHTAQWEVLRGHCLTALRK